MKLQYKKELFLMKKEKLIFKNLMTNGLFVFSLTLALFFATFNMSEYHFDLLMNFTYLLIIMKFNLYIYFIYKKKVEIPNYNKILKEALSYVLLICFLIILESFLSLIVFRFGPDSPCRNVAANCYSYFSLW